jgi:hypothetical protein
MKNPLLRFVGLLILVAGALVAWVGVKTITASQDASVRRGLDYQAFLGAIDDLTTGPGDSTLLAFHRIEEEIGRRRSVTYDTIAILADVTEFPAFDRAGFLYDQVQVYNRFQRERVALAQVSPEWFDRLSPFNPSVFRTYRRPDGSRGLTRSASAWSLRVESPLEGDWNGEILAKDVHRGQGLLSPRLAVSLRKPIQLHREVRGRRQLCEFTPFSFEVRAYCLSEERIPQAIFRLASNQEEEAEDWAVAGWDDLWVDGQRIRAGDSVGIPGGTILRLNPLEPVVFAEYWEGVLSSRQWVNGRMQRRGSLPPPLDLFSALGRAAGSGAQVSSSADIHLSVRTDASMELNRRLEDFLTKEVGLQLDFAIMVLARIPDGEIVALAEVGKRRNRGRSSLLERVAPGSAVKPLLAAAILSERPELASLKIPARSGQVFSVLNLPDVPARRGFSTVLNCRAPESGRVDLRYFLRCSNNEYAASLVMAGLEPATGDGYSSGQTPDIPLTEGRVPRGTLLRSPLSRGINTLFDLPTDPTIADSTGRSRRNWAGTTFTDGTPTEVPFEVLPSQSRPALLAPGSADGTDLGLLYRYAYGAWENQWTLLDLTNAFARVTTDQRIQLSFFAGAPEADSPEPLGLGEHPWYGEFLAGLRGVADDGTARGLRTAWRREGLPPTVFAKTGTLSEPGEPGPLDDLFAKSLLFTVGESAGDSTNPISCGVAGGIYLRFTEGPTSGNLPSYQVQFAREKLGEFLQEYWEEFGGCPKEPEPVGEPGAGPAGG